jgi:hypothetical protein
MAPIHTYLSVLHAVKNKYRLGYHEFVFENVTRTAEGCTIFSISLTLTGEKALGIGGNKFI